MPRCELLLVALVGLSGCTSDGAEPRDELPHDALAQAAPMQDAGVAPPYVATFEASGTGCAPESWNARASPDRTTFTAQFSEFFAEVGPDQWSSVSRCVVRIRLRSDSDISYAIGRVAYSGYGILDTDMLGSVSVDPYLAGEPLTAVEGRMTLFGPFERVFRLDESISDDSARWSSCSRDHTLHVPALVSVEKTRRDATGFLNLSAVGREGRVVTTLRWRRCDHDSRDGGTAAAQGGVDAG